MIFSAKRMPSTAGVGAAPDQRFQAGPVAEFAAPAVLAKNNGLPAVAGGEFQLLQVALHENRRHLFPVSHQVDPRRDRGVGGFQVEFFPDEPPVRDLALQPQGLGQQAPGSRIDG